MNFSYISVAAWNAQSLKDIPNIFNGEIICSFKYMQWYLVVLDTTKSKLHSPILSKKWRKPLKNDVWIFQWNVELIILSVIFNNINVTSELNETCTDVPIFTVVNNLTNTTQNKI